jgi:hypothetical protein
VQDAAGAHVLAEPEVDRRGLPGDEHDAGPDAPLTVAHPASTVGISSLAVSPAGELGVHVIEKVNVASTVA